MAAVGRSARSAEVGVEPGEAVRVDAGHEERLDEHPQKERPQGTRLEAPGAREHLDGRPTLPFRYWNKGTISTIGRRRAVADMGRFHLTGFLAWMAYLSVHLFYLVGMRRRLVIAIDWMWSYLGRTRSARVITDTAEGERTQAHRRLPAHP